MRHPRSYKNVRGAGTAGVIFQLVVNHGELDRLCSFKGSYNVSFSSLSISHRRQHHDGTASKICITPCLNNVTLYSIIPFLDLNTSDLILQMSANLLEGHVQVFVSLPFPSLRYQLGRPTHSVNSQYAILELSPILATWKGQSRSSASRSSFSSSSCG